jgi:hypothetical protein
MKMGSNVCDGGEEWFLPTMFVTSSTTSVQLHQYTRYRVSLHRASKNCWFVHLYARFSSFVRRHIAATVDSTPHPARGIHLLPRVMVSPHQHTSIT